MRKYFRPLYVLLLLAAVGIFAVFLALGFDNWDYQAHDVEILLNFGVGLLSSVLTFLVLERYLKQMQDSDGRNKDGLNYNRFVNDVHHSKYTIRVMTTFVYPLTKVQEHAHLKANLIRAIDHACSKNPDIDVKILLLDPFCYAAEQRAEERKATENVILRIQENILELYNYKNMDTYAKSFSKVNVKLYSRLPPLILLQVDDKASISYYPRDKPINEAPRFEFSIHAPLGEFIDLTFDDLWYDEHNKELHQYMSVFLHFLQPEKHVCCVQFVKKSNTKKLYVLLNTENNEEERKAMQLIRHGSPFTLDWNNKNYSCTYTVLDDFREISQMVKDKYGSFSAQSVLEVKLGDSHGGAIHKSKNSP